MNIQKTRCDDWLNLMSYIVEFIHWPNTIFRGQAQDDWVLEPSLSRVLKTISYKDKKSLVTDHLSNFRLEIRGRRGANPRELEDNDLWALGQHYGLNTPLLDWSRSPWVALFFALTGEQHVQGSDRTLWALHTPDVLLVNKGYGRKKKYQVELIEPTIDENSRLVNQKGLFTKIEFGNDIESWVSNSKVQEEWVTLYKFTFPDKLRQKALMFLSQMNINHSSLFPDLLGSSMNTNIMLAQTDYIEESQRRHWADELDDDEFF